MSRYVVKAEVASEDRFWDDRMLPTVGHPKVFEEGPVKTGLVDANGNPIYRLPDAIGYLPHANQK